MFIRQATTPVFSTAFLRGILGAFVAVPGAELLDTPTVHLWQGNTITPNSNLEQADLDAAEADFTDYAAQALTLVQPVNMGAEQEGATGTVTFTVSDPGTITSNTIWGYWIEVGGQWMVAEKFASGQEVAMAFDGDQLVLVLRIPVAPRPVPA